MGTIHFDSEDYSGLLALVFALGFITLGLVYSTNWSNYFVLIGVVIYIIFLSKPFWFKNYIKLSNKSIYIRLNSRKGFKITLNEIIKVDFLYGMIVITIKTEDCFVFNTKNINESDLVFLNEILKRFTLERIKQKELQ